VVSRAVLPEWVPSWNCLTNVGASDSGMAMWPSVNFHHLSGRTFPFSLNQACFCEAHSRSHSDKGHGNKTAASEAEVCPPVKTAVLAFLPAFRFHWTAVDSPFWCPQQCMTTTCLGAQTAFSNFRNFWSVFNTFSPELEVLPPVVMLNDSIQSHYCVSGKTCHPEQSCNHLWNTQCLDD
jgi:hypothetical protein